MGLKNMILKAASTGLSVTGGTDFTFCDDGISIANGVHLVVPADTTYTTRRQCTAKYRPPTLDSTTKKYGKDKKSISFVVPKVLADGTIAYNTIRVEREVHPESTSAEQLELNRVGAQLCFDTDLDNFWSAGSLA